MRTFFKSMRVTQSASSLQERKGNGERYRMLFRKRENVRGREHLQTAGYADHTERSLKQKETDREKNIKNPNSSPSLFFRPSYRLSFCLHLHSALNKVLGDTWPVARRGAEFQSGPSEFRHPDGG